MSTPTENPVLLKNVNEKLEDVYIGLSDLRGVQTNALTKQTEISNIITKENDRLSDKKKTIDQAIENQKRIIYFNDNSRKIYSAYLKILVTIAITLGIVYLIRVLQLNIGSFIPDMVYNILYIAIISIGLIYVWIVYKGIRERDPYNFDELKLTAPHIGVPNSTSSGGMGFGSIVGCIGSQCCTPSTAETPGTKWDAGLGRCIFAPANEDGLLPITPEETQPADSTDLEQPSFDEGFASPNGAFEYAQYAPVSQSKYLTSE